LGLGLTCHLCLLYPAFGYIAVSTLALQPCVPLALEGCLPLTLLLLLLGGPHPRSPCVASHGAPRGGPFPLSGRGRRRSRRRGRGRVRGRGGDGYRITLPQPLLGGTPPGFLGEPPWGQLPRRVGSPHLPRPRLVWPVRLPLRQARRWVRVRVRVRVRPSAFLFAKLGDAGGGRGQGEGGGSRASVCGSVRFGGYMYRSHTPPFVPPLCQYRPCAGRTGALQNHVGHARIRPSRIGLAVALTAPCQLGGLWLAGGITVACFAFPALQVPCIYPPQPSPSR
jgi:hypothetical protein